MVNSTPTSLKEVLIIEPRVFKDERGFFKESYHKEKYQEAGIHHTFVQDNQSQSVKDVLRGLHYQLKHPQAKLIHVLGGAIFDVVVDIRQGSPTFGKWVGMHLSAQNHRQLYIPEGFAHGFCVLSEQADIEYKCSDFYSPDDEYGLRWNDPELNINWPIQNPLLSPKDAAYPLLSQQPKDNLPIFQDLK